MSVNVWMQTYILCSCDQKNEGRKGQYCVMGINEERIVYKWWYNVVGS